MKDSSSSSQEDSNERIPKSSRTIDRKRKRKWTFSRVNISKSVANSSFDNSYFPLLLAAAVTHGRNSAPAPLLRLLLRRLRRQIALSSSFEDFPISLLSLLPLLLSSSSSSVIALSAELVGLASLGSIEQNETIASDNEILNALVQSLSCGSRHSAKAVLNAVMDLSVSSFARDQLRDAQIIHKLLYILWQESTNTSRDSKRGIFENNKLLKLFVETITTLINTSNTDFSLRISPELIQKNILLFSKIMKENPDPKLAETIFRLSVNLPNPIISDLNELKFTIFGHENSNFDEFFFNYWEKSPFLIKKRTENSENNNSIFNSLINKWKNTDNIINTILQDLVSCPPISSDELNINNFLTEIPQSLTSPLKYNQDIKIVKTEGPNSKTETHFPLIEKYKQAFDEGYSIALKGMQFRNDQIALVSTVLSRIFGLPSIGVNLYLSPGGAQGLARHYDDHCVLVWQIIGSKSWRVFKDPIPVLPRLYEPLNNYVEHNDEKNGEIMEILLEEGDILYIPRGYFHEARTDLDANCSLHLTFAIEIERPFEWEGFEHVAIHCWYEKLRQNSKSFLLDSNFENPNLTFTLILHVSIKLIGDHDPTFRKACLVASNFEISTQKSIFDQIISIINEKSNFLEAFNWIKLVCEKGDEDSLESMRWLRHLDQNENEFCNLFDTLEKYVVPCNGKLNDAREEFDSFKGYFCKFVVFEDACKCFGVLLEKYRKARNQYMKGMLGLHTRC